MNRHLIAFLSVFSLGLVLSIYYVLIPRDVPKEVNNTFDSIDVSESEDHYFASLKLQREEEHKDKIDSFQMIMVSTNASAEEKKSALEKIEAENRVYSLELEIDNKITDLGYPNAYTRIIDKDVSLVIGKNDKEEPNEVKILYLVLVELNDHSFDIALSFR